MIDICPTDQRQVLLPCWKSSSISCIWYQLRSTYKVYQTAEMSKSCCEKHCLYLSGIKDALDKAYPSGKMAKQKEEFLNQVIVDAEDLAQKSEQENLLNDELSEKLSDMLKEKPTYNSILLNMENSEPMSKYLRHVVSEVIQRQATSKLSQSLPSPYRRRSPGPQAIQLSQTVKNSSHRPKSSDQAPTDMMVPSSPVNITARNQPMLLSTMKMAQGVIGELNLLLTSDWLEAKRVLDNLYPDSSKEESKTEFLCLLITESYDVACEHFTGCCALLHTFLKHPAETVAAMRGNVHAPEDVCLLSTEKFSWKIGDEFDTNVLGMDVVSGLRKFFFQKNVRPTADLLLQRLLNRLEEIPKWNSILLNVKDDKTIRSFLKQSCRVTWRGVIQSPPIEVIIPNNRGEIPDKQIVYNSCSISLKPVISSYVKPMLVHGGQCLSRATVYVRPSTVPETTSLLGTLRSAQKEVSDIDQGARKNPKKQQYNHIAKISKAMHQKLNEDESALENINAFNRPSKIVQDYLDLMSTQWLEAKDELDVLHPDDSMEETKNRLLCDVLVSAQEVAQDYIGLYHGCLQHIITGLVDIPLDEKHICTPQICLLLSSPKMPRGFEADSLGLDLYTALVQSVKDSSHKVNAAILQQETWRQVIDKSEWTSLLSKKCRYEQVRLYTKMSCTLAWRMVVQKPPLTFVTPHLGLTPHKQTEDIHLDCVLTRDSVISSYVSPVLQQKDKFLTKGKVFIMSKQDYEDRNL